MDILSLSRRIDIVSVRFISRSHGFVEDQTCTALHAAKMDGKLFGRLIERGTGGDDLFVLVISNIRI